MNKLDRYDYEKMQKAKSIILEVYEYNYIPSTSLTKKMDTILSKIDRLLETELDDKVKRELQKKEDSKKHTIGINIRGIEEAKE